MKNTLFLFATFVLVSFGVVASTNHTENTSVVYPDYNDFNNSFTFVESGVTFAVFQNGEFDFYINPRKGLHVGYHGNGVDITFNSGYNYDAYVQYDDYGAVIQVENIFIDYDYYGRVSRIGNVRINYHRGRLISLGGLHVYYNKYGEYSYCTGYINNYNRHYVYHPYHNYFVRPLFDFRIVSYKPYRHHYKPIRYTYYADHSRNKYYNNNYRNYAKRDRSYSTNYRVATTVPKRESDRTNYNSANSTKNITHRDGTETRRSSSANRVIEYGRHDAERNTTNQRNYSSDRSSENNKRFERATTNNNNSNTHQRTTTITKRSPEKSVKIEKNVVEKRVYKTTGNANRNEDRSRKAEKSSSKERTNDSNSRRRG
jgi:hypothetical protein